ncbi:hypothetical protein P278_33420 [Zhouia amylolytica AD3]|uniref:Uncharacterized protein n=1 Tax=Zhouia amylolytica AD3 TaxID=1286632 RepID=W2UKF5_9FLAO|nr:hypothetical protein P278_33420 [Zhouia amylolytica AD3]
MKFIEYRIEKEISATHTLYILSSILIWQGFPGTPINYTHF